MEKKRVNKELLNELGYEDVTIFENPDYDEAIVGVDNNNRVVYDFEKMVGCLVKEGMDYEEAVEFIEYNTIRAIPYFPNGPVVMYPLDEYAEVDDGESVDDDEENEKTYVFNAEEEKKRIVEWIRDWFEENGKGCNAVLGLSGGKDSTICAALLAEALGKDRVIGVAMPDEGQGLNEADEIAKHLGIRFMYAPINGITQGFNSMWYAFGDEDFKWSEQSRQNIPPRIRMTMLYAIAQTFNGRVVGTCNASENYVGYFTRYGDGASDIEPLGDLTVRQVKEIGYALNLPREWVDKIPDDGLPNSCPDDEKFAKWGFSYAAIDEYLEKGTNGNKETDDAIEKMHGKTFFKMGLGTMYKKPI